jgi:hypothetical protein
VVLQRAAQIAGCQLQEDLAARAGQSNDQHNQTQEDDGMTEEEQNRLKSIFQGAIHFIYGMAGHDMTRFAMKTRGSMEHLFILITMGDLLGVPILPPYYSLRLLPYVVPQISTWKRRMLRERDLTDALA